MNACRRPLHCFVPPYILEHLAENAPDPGLRRLAVDTLQVDAAARAVRSTFAALPMLAAIPSPAGTKNRLVYDMGNRRAPTPGTLVRSEGDPAVSDIAVNEAYDHAGATYDFYAQAFQRNSLDGQGMTLVSSVHLGRRINNAFWNGQQMQYGDGDGVIFDRFTNSLGVVAHELTHGVTQHESNLVYLDEPGALSEHFSDVMGALAEQWHVNLDVTRANWYVGSELLLPGVGVPGIRSFTAGPAYQNHPLLGTDPQPKHMSKKYTGSDDNGGVHINSGIPNHAFYLAAIRIGGHPWQKIGIIWYKTLRALNRFSQFHDAAAMTYQVAGTEFGTGSLEQQAVQAGWAGVGIIV